jgi:hypothetical protein
VIEFPCSGTPEDRIEDRDFGDLILTGIDEDRPEAKSWGVRVDSTYFGIPKAPGFAAPQPGDRVRMWPAPNWGSRIRGVALRGIVVHYRTEAEDRQRLEDESAERDAKKRAEYEATGKAEQQARYEQLPEAFRQRIDKYRGNNPNFGWTFESYELFCCEQAVVFAREAAAAVERGDCADDVVAYFEGKPAEDVPPTPALRWLFWWGALSTEDFDYDSARQAELMPGFDEGHSGNTFGSAFNLACLWLQGDHAGIVRRFGSMAPVVGSDAYGDLPPNESAEAAK